MVKEQIIKSCRHLLKPILNFLLRNGVTWKEFSEISKDMYVEVARQEYGIQGRPTNNARVAVLTGLSRREVARVRDKLLAGDDSPDQRQGNRISQILTGWHVDQEFINATGKPKVLAAVGEVGSFSSLLKRYAGDLPHVSLKKEMLQLGLIEQKKDGCLKVLQRDYVYAALDPDIVRQMSVALHDHAATLDHNLDPGHGEIRRFEGMADNAQVSARFAKSFARLVENRGLEFLQQMDGWLASHETEQTRKSGSRAVRMGVGIYLIHDDMRDRLSQ